MSSGTGTGPAATAGNNTRESGWWKDEQGVVGLPPQVGSRLMVQFSTGSNRWHERLVTGVLRGHKGVVILTPDDDHYIEYLADWEFAARGRRTGGQFTYPPQVTGAKWLFDHIHSPQELEDLYLEAYNFAAAEGVVLEENGLRIIAFEVNHGDFVKQLVAMSKL